ncbi:MAG: hypothetical protein MJ105_00180 [Lachnospiraceae bacterium]|nr:hypothetical protein [Lachnospiraceae bacterium]
MTDRYMDMLKDSLEQKKKLLDEILLYTVQQKSMVEADKMDWDAFDQTVDDKAALIEKLEGLDSGFTAVYDRIRENLQKDKDYYKADIQEMQRLIKEVTDRSTSLMAAEERNKALVTARFQAEKKKFSQQRSATKATNSYYNAMNRINHIDPQLMDKKE